MRFQFVTPDVAGDCPDRSVRKRDWSSYSPDCFLEALVSRDWSCLSDPSLPTNVLAETLSTNIVGALSSIVLSSVVKYSGKKYKP